MNQIEFEKEVHKRFPRLGWPFNPYYVVNGRVHPVVDKLNIMYIQGFRKNYAWPSKYGHFISKSGKVLLNWLFPSKEVQNKISDFVRNGVLGYRTFNEHFEISNWISSSDISAGDFNLLYCNLTEKCELKLGIECGITDKNPWLFTATIVFDSITGALISGSHYSLTCNTLEKFPYDVDLFETTVKGVARFLDLIPNQPELVKLNNNIENFDTSSFDEQKSYIEIPTADLPEFTVASPQPFKLPTSTSDSWMWEHFTDALIENAKAELICNDLIGALKKIAKVKQSYYGTFLDYVERPFFIIGFCKEEFGITLGREYFRTFFNDGKQRSGWLPVENNETYILPKEMVENMRKFSFGVSKDNVTLIFEEGITNLNSNVITQYRNNLSIVISSTFSEDMDLEKILGFNFYDKDLKCKLIVHENPHFKIPKYQYDILKEHGLLYSAE